MKTHFVWSEPIAKNIRSLYFEPAHKVHFLAGQYTEIKLPHKNPDERGEKRWFTISAAPTEKLLAITTKFSEPGSSFKKTLSDLDPGTDINLAEPMGDFVLPKDTTIPLLFVAGGMGITPMRSMVKCLLDSGEKRDITLLFGVTDESDFVFRDIFDAYSVKATYVVKNPSTQWKGETGSLSVERIMALPAFKDSRTYLSGPEPMIEAFVKEFGEKGIPESQLVTDYFPGYQAI